MSENKHIDEAAASNGGTMQFSINSTRHVSLKRPGKRLEEESEEQREAEALERKEREEEELLKNQALPTEFEDVFSDEEKQEEDSASAVVSVEEVFKQKAEMINEDFHDETGKDEEPVPNQKLKRVAIILGIISGVVILAAIAVGIIIVL